MRRRSIITSGIVAAVLLGTACGGGTDFRDAVGTSSEGGSAATGLRARLVSSVSQTYEARSARFEMRAGFNHVPQLNFDLHATGAFDFAHNSGSIVVDAGTFRIEERVVKGVVYLHMPPGLVPSDKPWLRMAPDAVTDASVEGLTQSQSDPSQILSYLAGVSDDVKFVERDTVRGEPTTHYRATVDMNRALDQSGVPPSARENLKDLAPQLAGAKMPIDVWIDAQGRTRKLTIEMDLANLFSGSSLADSLSDDAVMELEMELYDFGTPVTVAAPPASEVTGG